MIRISACVLIVSLLCILEVRSDETVCHCDPNAKGDVAVDVKTRLIITSPTNGTAGARPNDNNACCNGECKFHFNTSLAGFVVKITIATCKNMDSAMIKLNNYGGDNCYWIDNCNDMADFNSVYCSSDVELIMKQNAADGVLPMQILAMVMPAVPPAGYSPPPPKSPPTEPSTPSAAPTSPGPTTSTTTTTPAPEQHNNPAELQAELAIAIDENSAAYDKIIEFVNYTVSVVTFQDKEDVPGVRLSLQWISATEGDTNRQTWMSMDAFNMSLYGHKQPDPVTPSKYGKTLVDYIGAAFEDKTKKLRPNSQKILLILTSDDAADSDSKDLTKLCNSIDVHPIILNFGNSSKLRNLETIFAGPVAEVKAELGDDLDGAESALEKSILSGDEMCPLSYEADPVTSLRTIKSTNFQDLNLGDEGGATAKPGTYCSFQNASKVIAPTDDEVAAGKKYLNMTVKYELETEKDSVVIIDSQGTEQAFFSGYDVVGSHVCFKEENEATLVLRTDGQQVYRGFIATATFVDHCHD